MAPTEFADPCKAQSAPERLHRATETYGAARARLVWLWLLVQADAFRSAPLLYLQGVAWRMRGLRVRSRNRLSALAGRSPHAYSLWIERVERAREHQPPLGIQNIWPVVDCRKGSAGLEETLASIVAAGAKVDPIVIGSEAPPGTRQVANVRELGAILGEHTGWLLPLAPGDRLSPRSLATYASAANHSHNANLIYADDDLSSGGIRQEPHFKPDWNAELFQHHDFISGSAIVRVERETLAALPDDDWVAALTRRAVQRGAPIHITQILHHRAWRPRPVVPAKHADSICRKGPKVTAIVPTRNGYDLLRTCLEGLRSTAYEDIETIVVDNGSDDPTTLAYLEDIERGDVTIIRAPGPFNYSKLNNAAVKQATGELLCFLNNDVEMIDPDWLGMLVLHATKADIGAVGARLLYPDGTIQHAGVFTGIGGGAGHAHRFQRADDPGYFERARLPQRVSAVTAACMVVAREKFVGVGGFNEELFPVAFNDVDLCLKLNSRGWQSFYEPRSTLIHHESKSRGSDRSGAKRARFAGELAALKRMWNTDELRDPYHHPHLSPFCEQFLIAV